jgi:NitT/TauT family transport system substrate-binding protein
MRATRFIASIAVFVVLAACSSAKTPAASPSSSASSGGAPVTVHIGHFLNLTHAPAIYALEKGIYAKDLGGNVTIAVSRFNAGPEEVQAFFSNDLDIGFIGPSPAVNAFVKSNAVRIIAGAASGGAALVVKPSITDVSQLKGKILASPQLGNTQDVALRTYLKAHGFKTTTTGTGGNVTIRPQDNSQTLDTFKQGKIDGAWVPEPYVSRLVNEDGGHILVDESSLWPGGKYTTTVVLVRKTFADEHPDIVKKFLQAHVEAIEAMNANPADAQTVVNNAIAKVTGKALKPAVLADAWKHLTFTWDPLVDTIQKSADDALALKLIASANINGIDDLSLLNELLKAAGKPTV